MSHCHIFPNLILASVITIPSLFLSSCGEPDRQSEYIAAQEFLRSLPIESGSLFMTAVDLRFSSSQVVEMNFNTKQAHTVLEGESADPVIFLPNEEEESLYFFNRSNDSINFRLIDYPKVSKQIRPSWQTVGDPHDIAISLTSLYGQSEQRPLAAIAMHVNQEIVISEADLRQDIFRISVQDMPVPADARPEIVFWISPNVIGVIFQRYHVDNQSGLLAASGPSFFTLIEISENPRSIDTPIKDELVYRSIELPGAMYQSISKWEDGLKDILLFNQCSELFVDVYEKNNSDYGPCSTHGLRLSVEIQGKGVKDWKITLQTYEWDVNGLALNGHVKNIDREHFLVSMKEVATDQRHLLILQLTEELVEGNAGYLIKTVGEYKLPNDSPGFYLLQVVPTSSEDGVQVGDNDSYGFFWGEFSRGSASLQFFEISNQFQTIAKFSSLPLKNIPYNSIYKTEAISHANGIVK